MVSAKLHHVDRLRRESVLTKNNMPRDIDPTGGMVKTLISLMLLIVP